MLGSKCRVVNVDVVRKVSSAKENRDGPVRYAGYSLEARFINLGIEKGKNYLDRQIR